MFSGDPLVEHVQEGAAATLRDSVHISSPQEDQTKGEALRFEIMRLDDIDGSAIESTVVDAASVNRIVQQAAAIGQRIYIRPADTAAR
ncbi:hypothetical protein GCM10009574_007850 [Streptomyces asiaticus]|uniref:Uncharacterized protein n=2 Tax=Streptomyces rhizosphaericus TaxID=114699 RepID=A0ABN1PSQ1_9ACTN